ncbi:aminotransferase-like domain-containing protein [Seonamhaeicola marinus]|uniref:PLP-dependent aminotransferase family protein n=1 Tax=Seonamhaeicola marinus TaxID=1912246 RepID=A0A5D0HTQ5_9FLAO|nr:PLP-dependent aminotransferase family protein [Seonamhaeicola marinus]TYA74695.1 PLP-dependent aminotransferase family protein [Seonamhaeicola marinus]
MIPYKTIVNFSRESRTPVYIQLTNQFIQLIKDRTLLPRTRLPGSRTLAELLEVHRKTVVACYEELVLQGWAESIPQKGTYVHHNLPELNQQKLDNSLGVKENNKSGFYFNKDTTLDRNFPQAFDASYMYVNDGVNDERLTPTDEIGVIYRKLLGKKSNLVHFGYGTTYGNLELRTTLVDYLNETRGLNISLDNIMITRGSQMGMFLSSQILFENGGYIIVGETNYSSSDTTFEYAKANILRVPVEDDGLSITAIEKLCKDKNIRAVYTTSHHHHPTTVTMSAKKRLQLLNLAKCYEFAIIEDDYDYDFNYNHAPILPLASHDVSGNVIYVGSICKTVAPVFRVGYLVASKDFVDECAKLRRFIDRQGDAILEMTFAKFIKEGSLDRHKRKVLKTYKERRDLFCKLLKEELGAYLTFEIPKGGMAVWVTLSKTYTWSQVTEVAKNQKLLFVELQRYDRANIGHNGIRIGFARYNTEEIKEFIKRLKTTLLLLDA